MKHYALALAACLVAGNAHADLSADIEKLKVDDRAWFYLRACADEEISPLRDLLDKYGARVYSAQDTSDDANDWKSRYLWSEKRDVSDPECVKARSVLLNSVYAPALAK